MVGLSLLNMIKQIKIYLKRNYKLKRTKLTGHMHYSPKPVWQRQNLFRMGPVPAVLTIRIELTSQLRSSLIYP